MRKPENVMQIAESGRRTRLPVLLAVTRASCRHGRVALLIAALGGTRRAGHQSSRSSALGLTWTGPGWPRARR